MEQHTQAGVEMTVAAYEWTREVAMSDGDIESDVHRIRTGATTREQLTALCRDGAEEDRHAAIAEYVDAVVLVAGATS